MGAQRIRIHEPERVSIEKLKPHPRNYRDHPEDQLRHIEQSIRDHGFYRNVVVARDWTILAGHGVVEASRRLGLEEIPVVRIGISPDSTRALRILAADNYLGHFSFDDDRILTDLLRELREKDALLGTGFAEESVAALAMVTRPASELEDFDAAAEWVGLPEFRPADPKLYLVLAFRSESERDSLIRELGVVVSKKTRGTWSAPYPPDVKADLESLRFE